MAITNNEVYDVEYYTNKTMKAFDDMKVDGVYTYDGIKANVEAWMTNKQPLFNLLRKHPNWNEEAKAVVFTNEEIRMPDINEYRDAFDDLIRCVYNYTDITNELERTRTKNDGSAQYHLFNMLKRIRDNMFDSVVTETMTQVLERFYSDIIEELHIKVGQKFSRVLNRIFKYCKLDQMTEYNKLFARISDTINPLKATKISVLSVNFLDFLLMSNGNSWSTCQTIIHNGCEGIYKAGTLSYANDKISVVYYTIDKNYEGTDYCLEPKITRQIFFYKNNLLVQERLYPKSHDYDDKASEHSLVTQYRNVVESIIATCEGKPNFWEKAEVDICATSDSFMYRDWDHFDNWIYRIKGEDIPKRITVGNTSYCLHCGKPKDYTGEDNECRHLYCDECYYLVKCAHCGKIIDARKPSWHPDSNYVPINGQYYCRDCGAVAHCDFHDRWELVEPNQMRTVEGYGQICPDAYNYLMSTNQIYRCSECGSCISIRSNCGDMNIRFYNGKPVCSNCLNDIQRITDVQYDEENLTWILTPVSTV